jgi:hypothetical protein
MDITITVTGLDELVKKCNDPALLGEPIREFFQKSTLAIQVDAQTLTPVDTGRLRASITSLVDASPMPLFGQVGTNMIPHYGPDIEYGTRPHFPPISALVGWAHRHGMNPYAVARKIARYGTKPYQMFQKAASQNMSNIEVFLKEAADAIEARWGSK